MRRILCSASHSFSCLRRCSQRSWATLPRFSMQSQGCCICLFSIIIFGCWFNHTACRGTATSTRAGVCRWRRARGSPGRCSSLAGGGRVGGGVSWDFWVAVKRVANASELCAVHAQAFFFFDDDRSFPVFPVAHSNESIRTALCAWIFFWFFLLFHLSVVLVVSLTGTIKVKLTRLAFAGPL